MKLNVFFLLISDSSNSLLMPKVKYRTMMFPRSKSKSNDFEELENEAAVIKKIVDAVDQGICILLSLYMCNYFVTFY